MNFKDLKKKNIKYLLCYADEDDLVDRPAAVAPCDFTDAEVTVFPKGHGSIATSWSNPSSACALHREFEHKGKTYRGPVKWQLDLSAEQSREDAGQKGPAESKQEFHPPAQTYVMTRALRRIG